MRRMTMAVMALVAALGGAAVLPTGAEAAQPVTRAEMGQPPVQPVQYYGDHRPYDGGGWASRHHWREHRRARDEARIAEAARREAYQIERERAERRAWRQAQRQHYSYYRGW
jgi:hypothetical protein